MARQLKHQPFYFFPELQSSSCGNPGVPAKGILNGTRFNVGDRIQYRCVPGYTLDGHAQLTCVTSTSNVAAWDFPVPICRAEDTCGGTFRSSSGVISSSDFKNDYKNSGECMWTIVADPGDTISLVFTDFQMDNKFDYLEVEGSEPPSIWLSGTNIPVPIVSNKNWLRLHFVTDNSHRHKGFTAQYQVKRSGDFKSRGVKLLPGKDNTSKFAIMNEGGVKQVSNDCSDPGEPENGRRIGDDFSIGATVGFTCDGDHVLQGSKSITCQRVAEVLAAWSDHPPVCKVKTCGSNLYGPSGTFTSPNFPIQYESNSQCVWIITASNPNKVIQINFEEFDLELGYDTLTIGDGGEVGDSRTIIQVLTGSFVPDLIVSMTHQMWLHLQSDESVGSIGFKINYKEIDKESCGDPGIPLYGFREGAGFSNGDVLRFECQFGFELIGERTISCQNNNQWSANIPICIFPCLSNFTAASGTVLSPDYPEGYGNNLNCVWLIIAEQGSRIQLAFNDFDLEPPYDFLTVRDGELLGRFTGAEVPSHLTSNSNVLQLEFQADHSMSGRGFNISYSTFGHNECPDPGVPMNAKRFGNNFQLGSSVSVVCEEGFIKTQGSDTIVCELEEGGVMWSGLIPKCEAPCGGHFTAPVGVILSPGWPGYYKDSLSCEWVIEAEPGHSIKLSFDRFQTELNYDFLEIHDGPNLLSPLIASLNGTQVPHFLFSSGSFLYLLFTTDSSRSNSGFKLFYEIRISYRIGQGPGQQRPPSAPLTYRAPVEIGLLLVEEVEEGGECTDRGRRGKVGCELEEKERFWSELDEVMESIPTGERVVIGVDFNGHVGEENTGDEEVMGKFGVKERNLEGQVVVDFAKRMDMAVVNTYFQKREEHRVTYKSGDLEKAYDRVPKEELWYCMRKSGVAEKYVRVVQDMYERSRTVVRCAVGQTEEFKVEVGLHQGSALSHFLFAMVMDQLSEEVRQESPWAMMFADDIVICSESREQVEESLERGRFVLERRGMNVSRSVTLDTHSCLDPGVPVNGARNSHDLSIGSVLRFWCDAGYRLSHDEPLVCERNHWWSHPLPSCDALCGGDVKGPDGIILSPGFPELYPNSLNCTWTVEVSHGKGVQFTFHAFHLEDHHDYLLVTENGSFAQPLARLTGSQRPPTLNAGLYGNFRAQLRFISDFSISFHGFNISFAEYDLEPCEDPGAPRFGGHSSSSFGVGDVVMFWCLPGYRLQGPQGITCLGGGRRTWSAPLPRCVAECGSTVSQNSGVLLSPNYPLNYDNNHECIYNIQVQRGKGINITASSFRLAQGDILKVYDGPDNTADLIGAYSGSSMLGVTLSSTSNHLWLEFFSDQDDTAEGFKLNYSSKDSAFFLDGTRDFKYFITVSWVRPQALSLEHCRNNCVTHTTFTFNPVTGYLNLASQGVCEDSQSSRPYNDSDILRDCFELSHCDEPGVPQFGSKVSDQGHFAGSAVTYQCDPGYTLHGSGLLTCMTGERRTWDHQLPSCIVAMKRYFASRWKCAAFLKPARTRK
ncbi:hypothetical protein QTP70_018872 [Hemibagrus guttatus]|uniref:Uncharacterized protein n=1 Tax=Hemibagrus guttatus TaxID=175788 RepID=A0AAE0Q7R7_9TELE|nr:hypothetical protein QTP70_018872 [Hemibagrus guttatus]